MSNFRIWKLVSLLCVLSLMLGCESKEERIQQTITHTLQEASTAINTLGTALDKKQVRNANLLTEYGKVLGQQKPQLSEIAQIISQDATSSGTLYQSLLTRYQSLKSPAPSMNSDDIINQALLLKEAASISLFNDALTDPINVLADMSDGKLARVGAISQQAEQTANGQTGVGNQLVGNANYGEWQTNSNGTSFWMWYGMYRMLGDIVGDVEYGRWSKHRKYSYYSDYGRHRYTSYKSYKRQTELAKRTQQSYQRQGKQFTSPYAKKKSGASGLSRSSNTPSAVTRSSYSRTSSYGSVRNSSSRTSRGVSRGK
ncbi:CHAD domain-containing protein [Pseudoalteromonas sp. CO348]|uniref:CHAD domain-containing protein n=1 Tax=Pseudoalteromonas TaxID=53246 RepID=UPI001023AAE6|nr:MULTISPECIES: CHAD domain-containing protein [Pseudoalteromonas]MCG7538160.1 CHAD domain-containing protein [Pseudoalteromonas sp. OF7H-1]QZO12094.1 CHAD domain-containing protein [Pseudoalteromonas piscicida]RZG08692.1 CHAD domain-containing protein [Pseudoalteromonas sp. CO348]RZG17542.1 CHAD domain-containing protein [Pseudoalteromonas sp. CO342X]